MVKTIEQKSKDVVERARKFFPYHRDRWLSMQPGGREYQAALEYGKDHAEILRKGADVQFRAAMRRAKVDHHGNPLENKK